MRDRAAGGVPDQDDLAGGWVDGVDHLDDRVDVVAQGDSRAIGTSRLHARQRERVGAVSRLLQHRDDLVPGRAVKPETGDQDDVHRAEARPGCWIQAMFPTQPAVCRKSRRTVLRRWPVVGRRERAAEAVGKGARVGVVARATIPHRVRHASAGEARERPVIHYEKR